MGLYILDERMSAGPSVPEPVDRFWTNADGESWRVSLQPPARHILAEGDDRMILTFTGRRGSEWTRLPAGSDLESLADDVGELYARAVREREAFAAWVRGEGPRPT